MNIDHEQEARLANGRLRRLRQQFEREKRRRSRAHEQVTSTLRTINELRADMMHLGYKEDKS